MGPIDEVLTIEDVALHLKVEEPKVYELTRSRFKRRHGFWLKKFYIGKELRFLREDLIQFIEECKKDRG